MTTVVNILMSDIIPLRDRGVWQGIINIIYATGSGMGAPLGSSCFDFTLKLFLLTFEQEGYWPTILAGDGMFNIRPVRDCVLF